MKSCHLPKKYSLLVWKKPALKIRQSSKKNWWATKAKCDWPATKIFRYKVEK